MTRSKRLVCGAANRQITFYDLTSTNYFVPTSTIKDLVALPTCMEYYRWPEKTEGKIETLLVGDSLGNVHKYDFKQDDWHICSYDPDPTKVNECHNKEIKEKFE